MGVDLGGRADCTGFSDAAARYADKPAKMWGFMKERCKAGSLPDDRDLAADPWGNDQPLPVVMAATAIAVACRSTAVGSYGLS